MRKITSFLLILSSCFSWARFRQKVSGLRLSLPLLSRVFFQTLTLALLFFFLLFPLLLSPISQVEAQEPTVTVTPFTPVPLFPSSTPEPTLDVTCPEGQNPAGWGTVTPDAYWSLYCGNCVTPISQTGTPEPVSTFMVPLTQTAQASITPSPTFTSTATPLPTSTPATGLLNFGSVTLAVAGSPYISGQVGSYMSVPSLNTPSNLYYITGNVSAYDWNSVIGGDVHYEFWFDPLVTSGNQIIYYSYRIYNRTGSAPYFVTGAITEVGSGSFTNQYNTVRLISIGESSSASRSTGLFGASFELWVSTYPYDAFSTPTPIPTPTFFSYCSTVLPASGGEDLSGQFALPVPMLGGIRCPVNFPGLTIPLFGVLGLPDFEIPNIIICFQEVDFGTLRYFGIDIEVDYLSFVLAAALVVSMFVRK